MDLRPYHDDDDDDDDEALRTCRSLAEQSQLPDLPTAFEVRLRPYDQGSELNFIQAPSAIRPQMYDLMKDRLELAGRARAS